MLLAPVALSLAQSQSQYPAYSVKPLSGVTISGLPEVTSRLCVDQFGYLPDAAKVAVISDPVKGYNAFDHYTPGAKLEVRTCSGKTVFSGPSEPWKDGAVHEDSGDKGWWFDFSSLRAPGQYYVYDPSTEKRSPVFRIGAGVFKPVLTAAARMFYYQREAMPIESKYAQGPWVDDADFLQDKQMRYVNAKSDRSQDRDMSGGWMDAGDTDKYPPFNGDVIHPLLYAYTANPRAFTDDFGIPESGNGLPDLLDEIKYQLDWLIRSQFPDGALPIKEGNIDYAGVIPLSKDLRPRYYGPKDSGSTIFTCANFAHAARVYGKFPVWKRFAADLKQRAILAWNWYQSHPPPTISIPARSRAASPTARPRSRTGWRPMPPSTSLHLPATPNISSRLSRRLEPQGSYPMRSGVPMKQVLPNLWWTTCRFLAPILTSAAASRISSPDPPRTPTLRRPRTPTSTAPGWSRRTTTGEAIRCGRTGEWSRCSPPITRMSTRLPRRAFASELPTCSTRSTE